MDDIRKQKYIILILHALALIHTHTLTRIHAHIYMNILCENVCAYTYAAVSP